MPRAVRREGVVVANLLPLVGVRGIDFDRINRFVVASETVSSAAFYAAIGATPERASAVGLSDTGALAVHDYGMVIQCHKIPGTLRTDTNSVVVQDGRGIRLCVNVVRGVTVSTFENMEIGTASVAGESGIGGSNVVLWVPFLHVEDGFELRSDANYSDVRVCSPAFPNSSPLTEATQVEGTSKNFIVKNSVSHAARLFVWDERGCVREIGSR